MLEENLRETQVAWGAMTRNGASLLAANAIIGSGFVHFFTQVFFSDHLFALSSQQSLNSEFVKAQQLMAEQQRLLEERYADLEFRFVQRQSILLLTCDIQLFNTHHQPFQHLTLWVGTITASLEPRI